jgi:hypothetical protein
MTLPLLADAGFCSLCLGGKLADRDERTVPMRLTRNVCWGWKIKNRSKFRGLLNRPQRERLPRFQVGILIDRQGRANRYDKSRAAASFPRNSVLSNLPRWFSDTFTVTRY